MGTTILILPPEEVVPGRVSPVPGEFLTMKIEIGIRVNMKMMPMVSEVVLQSRKPIRYAKKGSSKSWPMLDPALTIDMPKPRLSGNQLDTSGVKAVTLLPIPPIPSRMPKNRYTPHRESTWLIPSMAMVVNADPQMMIVLGPQRRIMSPPNGWDAP